MYPAGFEPAIPASEQPQTHDLDRTATGISSLYVFRLNAFNVWNTAAIADVPLLDVNIVSLITPKIYDDDNDDYEAPGHWIFSAIFLLLGSKHSNNL
jgi:hypothetical protein